MGWTRGQGLGRAPSAAQGVRSFQTPGQCSASLQAEMWATLAGTIGSKKKELNRRIKRSRDGCPVPVRFTPGPVLEATLEPVTWHELSQALITMTEYGFSENGVVHVLNSSSKMYVQEQFHWGFLHVRLCKSRCLPLELQEGMNAASNEDKWSNTMKALLDYETYSWRLSEEYRKEYVKQVGVLWKTLEVAINRAKIDLKFCLFFCNQVMEALNWVNCGLMSFVPRLETNSTGSRQAQRFQAKVRYKGEGLDAMKRYRHKVTRTQSRERVLLRPFQAAKGILPVVSTRRQQQ